MMNRDEMEEFLRQLRILRILKATSNTSSQEPILRIEHPRDVRATAQSP